MNPLAPEPTQDLLFLIMVVRSEIGCPSIQRAKCHTTVFPMNSCMMVSILSLDWTPLLSMGWSFECQTLSRAVAVSQGYQNKSPLKTEIYSLRFGDQRLEIKVWPGPYSFRRFWGRICSLSPPVVIRIPWCSLACSHHSELCLCLPYTLLLLLFLHLFYKDTSDQI